MRVMKGFVLCLILIVFLVTGFALAALPCTLATTPLSRFDDTEYVFIGHVEGFTAPMDFDDKRAGVSVDPMSHTPLPGTNPRQKTVGLIVRMTEKIHVPRMPARTFEVYRYGLGADCSIRGADLTVLKAAFPIGSEVRVIAKEAIFITGPVPRGVIRLEERPGDLGSIALNSDKTMQRMSSAASVFIYKEYSYDMNRDSTAHYLLAPFEIRKDLLRLRDAKTQTERDSILERLVYAPPHADVALGSLFDTYAANPAEAGKYFETNLKLSSPEMYKQYKVVRRVFAEFERLGYGKKLAEEAIGKALSEGTDFEFDALLKRSLQVLKEQGAKLPKP